MRMLSACDFLGPTVGNCVILPRACADRRLLQNEQIVAAPAGALAHTEAQIVPSNQVDGLNGEGDAEMVGFAQTVCVDPAHEVSAGLEYACALEANVVDILLGHRRQCGTATLTRAFIAEFQMVEDAAIASEVEKVKRRIEALGDAADTVVNFPTHTDGAPSPTSYEELGPAPPGERCIHCGAGNGVKRIRHSGRVDTLHPACVDRYLAAPADPQAKVPGRPPDPLDEHSSPAAPSSAPSFGGIPFMITLEMKARLRLRGFTDDDIVHMRPQQAMDILAEPDRSK
jgi:hypothetical protein